MKKLSFFASLVLLLFLSPSAVKAVSEFETKQEVWYRLDPQGQMRVEQKMTLTNLLSHVYVTQYAFMIKGIQINQVQAQDDSGPIQPKIEKEGETTRIGISFNEPVVGTGKTLNFTLSYTTPDLAQQNGQVWEIHIPRLSNENPPDNYIAFLAIPSSFGLPALIKPQPIGQLDQDGVNLYRFSKAQVLSQGINAIFGQFQVFDFSLTYHLENPYLKNALTQIALPPDTAWQQLVYQQLEPLPLNVYLDEDGNWLADYQLGPKQRLNVLAQGQAKIFAQPRSDFPPPDPVALEKNLLPQEYWPVNHSLITEKAADLKTAKAIYQYVVNSLNYDFTRISEELERQGALGSLANPNQAICMEFTDLFITLARAAGIPAREINGFSYTTNDKVRPLGLLTDVLHAWPEYWDKERGLWVPVDPTWEKTTGGVDYFSKTDLNHFAFVIHGLNSKKPYPAGAYKTDDLTSKDVEVSFGRYQLEKPVQPTVEFDLPEQVFWESTNQGWIKIKNSGSLALYQLPLEIKTEGLNLTSEPVSSLAVLLPYSYQEVAVRFKPKADLASSLAQVTVRVGDQEFSQTLRTGSFWLELLPFLGVILLAILALTFLTRIKVYAKR